MGVTLTFINRVMEKVIDLTMFSNVNGVGAGNCRVYLGSSLSDNMRIQFDINRELPKENISRNPKSIQSKLVEVRREKLNQVFYSTTH